MKRSQFELLLLDAEARRTSAHTFYDRLLELGTPPEIVYRLASLWRFTRRVGQRLIAVGKIILLKIVEFLAQHPGLCIGAAIGVVLTVLAAHIPFIGPIISPIAGMILIPFGVGVGHAIDTGRIEDSLLTNVIRAVKEFFAAVVDALRAAFLLVVASEDGVAS